MTKIASAILAATMLAAPVQGAEWNDVRAGAFVGARITIGGQDRHRPKATLTVAPTQSWKGHDGFRSMRIGEGIAFNLSPGSRPSFTLAGVRADRMLGLHPKGSVESGHKLGVSKGGWVAIGAGVVVLAGGIFVLHRINEADKNSD